MVSAPLAIDLFCGLSRKPQFVRRANPPVEQLVTGWAENPDHLTQAVGHQPPSPIAFMPRAMRNLQHPAFATGFAASREIGIFTAQTFDRTILVGAARIVDLLNIRLSLVESAALFLGRMCGAWRRAVSLIAVRRRNAEMLATDTAISAKISRPLVRALSDARRPSGAIDTAPLFVGPNRLKLSGAKSAKQIIHNRGDLP